MNWRDHIHSDPNILGGKPVVKGTRISVELIFEHLADGASVADVVDGFTHVLEEDVLAAFGYAGHVVRNTRKTSIPPFMANMNREPTDLGRDGLLQ
ncbi:MAG: hypothetical protein RL367_1378 [Pseudomonadota bacterium]|jgi:uncharacterized protein (DUF433 family)